MGVNDVKQENIVDQSSLAEELLSGRDIESVDWSIPDKRGFTVLHCLLSVSLLIEILFLIII